MDVTGMVSGLVVIGEWQVDETKIDLFTFEIFYVCFLNKLLPMLILNI